jgi:cell fate (sporulation/competence/biofilm development) regulator YlbF (YheA/YmcA/DUF963 family)
MSVYDKAHDLARALSTSKEYMDFNKALEHLKADAKAFEMLQDFRKKQLEAQAAELQGLDVKAQLETLQNLYAVISYNSLIREFLEAEARFVTMMADVQKIISKAVGLETDSTDNLLQ